MQERLNDAQAAHGATVGELAEARAALQVERGRHHSHEHTLREGAEFAEAKRARAAHDLQVERSKPWWHRLVGG